MKSILYVNRRAPSSSGLAREALDAALASAVFEQQLSILWMDDGVFQLLNNSAQQSASDLQKNLKALGLYGIEQLYVHQPSLTQRGIDKSQLIAELDVELLDDQQVAALFQQQQQIISF